MSLFLPNPSWAMATVVIDELVRCGVDHLVLAPGSRSGSLAMVAAGDGRIDLRVAIDERSAGFWAVGFAKATGRPAAVLTTSGTAVANLFPAVIEASESLTPLVVLSADRPFGMRYTGANQTIDQNRIFGGFPRFFADIPEAKDIVGEPQEWRSLVSRAVTAAGNGPVHLNLGFREPLVPASDDGRDTAAPYLSDTSGRAGKRPWLGGGPPAVEKIEFELEPRDLVVAGGGASLKLVEEALSAAVPVIAEGHSNCRIPGTISTAHHLLSGGFIELEPSRLVFLGRAGLSRPLGLLSRRIRSVVVAPSGGDPSRRDLPMVEAGEFVVESADRSWHALWTAADETARSIIDREIEADAVLTEPRTVRDVWRLLPEEAILAVGSSMPVRDLDWFAPPRKGPWVVANRGASGIDGFLSMAAGAGAARQPAYGLVGDLSLLHDSNGFLIAPRPDLKVVVINNQGGGIFSFLPQAQFSESFERVFAAPAEVDLKKLVTAFGGRHRAVETPAELAQEIATQSRGISIIEVRTDRSENVAVHRRLTAAVIEGVSAIRGLTASPPA